MERMNLNFGIPGDKKNKPVWVPLTLAEVTEWLKTRPYPEDVKAELIKRASRYPGNALRDFVTNISAQVAGIQGQRRKEQNEQ